MDFYDKINDKLTAKIEKDTGTAIEKNKIKSDIRKSIEEAGGVEIDVDNTHRPLDSQRLRMFCYSY